VVPNQVGANRGEERKMKEIEALKEGNKRIVPMKGWKSASKGLKGV
jgi:hypothetical protein